MIAWSEPLPDRRKPVKVRCARPAPPACGLNRLAAGRPFVSKRSWLHVSEAAPVATQAEMAA